MGEGAERLRRALEQVLPGVPFDEEEVTYFDEVDWAQASEEEVAEAWSPVLLSKPEAARDDEAAREACHRLLARLRGGEPGAAAPGGGAPPRLRVSGCTGSDSSTVNGAYVEDGTHNGRPVYKRQVPAGSGDAGDMFLYFWDRRDGPASSFDEAWVFGPEVGRGVIWRHSQTSSALPPSSDWKWGSNQVEGLLEWMGKLRIPPAGYAASAQAWCERKGITHVSGVASLADEFCDAIGLKKLERNRVLNGLSDLPTPPVVSITEEPPDVSIKEQYCIKEELGRGATATVHRCISHSGTQREQAFAMKIVSLARQQLQLNSAEAKEKMKREIEIVQSLRHPNIVALQDSFEQDDKLYLVMELVEGGELFDHITKAGRLKEPAAGFVFCQLVDALAYIHGRRIVHRDLKPENILVHQGQSRPEEGKLVVKISDFGHSKIIGEGYSIAKTRCGTPQYWAPEVNQLGVVVPSAKGYDEKVDIWSLGVVLYVMLEGDYPFRATGTRQPDAQYRPLQHGGRFAKEIVKGLIQKKPQDRWSLDTCLKHAWLQQLDIAPLNAAGQSRQADDEQFTLQVTPTETQAEKLRQELKRFNAKHKLFPAVLRDQKVLVTWSASPEVPPGSQEEARAELLGIISAFCAVGPASGAAAGRAAVGAPLATVAEERGSSRARPA